MKPRTKLQKRVSELSSNLPVLTAKQTEWAKRVMVEHTSYARKVSVLCTECGRSHPNTGYKDGSACVCQHCGTRTKIRVSRKAKSLEHAYFCIVQKSEEFQVFRYVYVRRTGKQGKKAEYFIDEVFQKWMQTESCIRGKEVTIIAKARLMGSRWWFDGWSHTSDLEIREIGSSYYAFDYNVPVDNTYPIQSWHKKYMMYGVDRQVKGVDPYILLNRVEGYSTAETLLKTKQDSLLMYWMNNSSNIRQYWPSIKICFRNKYIVKDAGMYLDYLEALHGEGKDIRNAHYVCPKNLKKAHDYYMVLRKKRLDREERERQEEEMLKHKEEVEAFAKRMAAFECLTLSEGQLTIEPIKTVEGIREEGNAMHHCVFTNGYWKRPSCLILSAKIEDQRVETVEVNLKTYKVVQSRAACNQMSPHHDRIISLVNRNIDKIKKMAI